MLPAGGGDRLSWAARMAALGLPEFHLLDREIPPATEQRQQAAAIVNEQTNCRACYERQDHEPAWEELPGRARKRCRETAKRWLNRQAVARMTPELLDERDPDGEVRGWLGTIAALASGRIAGCSPVPLAPFAAGRFL
jgi:hypothetical protein